MLYISDVKKIVKQAECFIIIIYFSQQGFLAEKHARGQMSVMASIYQLLIKRAKLNIAMKIILFSKATLTLTN